MNSLATILGLLIASVLATALPVDNIVVESVKEEVPDSDSLIIQNNESEFEPAIGYLPTSPKPGDAAATATTNKNNQHIDSNEDSIERATTDNSWIDMINLTSDEDSNADSDEWPTTAGGSGFTGTSSATARPNEVVQGSDSDEFLPIIEETTHHSAYESDEFKTGDSTSSSNNEQDETTVAKLSRKLRQLDGNDIDSFPDNQDTDREPGSEDEFLEFWNVDESKESVESEPSTVLQQTSTTVLVAAENTKDD